MGQRRTVVHPASDEFGGQQIFTARIGLAFLFQECVKAADVFMQLAIDHEAAVTRQQERGGRRRIFLRFVDMAEDEFAGRQRRPAILGLLAASEHALGRARQSFKYRVADAIRVTEMFLAGGLAVFEYDLRVLVR